MLFFDDVAAFAAYSKNTISNELRRLATSRAEKFVERLPELISQHPYCATYRMLYLVALANVHSAKLSDEIRRNAPALPDRTQLFKLINHGEYGWVTLMKQLEEQRRQQPEANDFELIDRFLSSIQTVEGKEVGYSIDDLASQPSLIQDEDEEEIVSMDIDPTQDELIDRFLEAESEGTLFVPQANPKEMQEDDPDLVKNITDRAFLTESLAKVYVKQHKYEQALAIFLELNLKYPKKNCYFADQIRYLEKVIEYTKQK